MGASDYLAVIGSFFVLIAVLVLTYVATRWYAKRMRGGTSSGRYIKVLEKSALGQGTGLAVVEIGGKYYLLGTGEKSVSLLCQLEDLEEQASETVSPSFQELMDNLLRRPRKEKGEKGKACSPNE